MSLRRLALLFLGFAPLAQAAEITPAHFAMADHYSRTHGGIALRVEQGGSVLFESYAPGWSPETAHRIFSGTKNFVAVTALIAQQDGLLNLDEPASKTLTEWQHDRRRNITLDQLLSQTSGLAPGAGIIDDAHDQMQAAVSMHLIAAPGTQFHYGPVGYQAFGEILKRKLRRQGRSVEGYMRDKLLDPLGIDPPYWKHDDADNPLMHAGMGMSASDWALFGNFVLHEYQGYKKQIIRHNLFMRLFIGHRANPAYGLGFWLNRPEPSPRPQKMTELQPAMDGDQLYPGGPRDLIAALGTGHQRLYMIPSMDLVIVRFSEGGRFSDGDFLSRLLNGRARPDAHTH